MTEYSLLPIVDGVPRSSKTESTRAVITRTTADDSASTSDDGADARNIAVETETRRYRPVFSDGDTLVWEANLPGSSDGIESPLVPLVESAADAAVKRLMRVAKWLGSQADLRGARAKTHSGEEDAFSQGAPDQW